MSILLLGIKLLAVILAASVIYYYSGIIKVVGNATVEEINDSELSISADGELYEEFPEEILTLKEAKTLNYGATILFILIGSLTWSVVGLICGNVAYLIGPSEFMKLLIYTLIYLFLLRLPFGVVNKAMKKTYELDVIPEKIIFAILMIAGYLLGINFFESMPSFVKGLLQ